MTNKPDQQLAQPEQTSNFLSAWEKRKQDVLLEKETLDEQQQVTTEDKSDPNVLLTDDDMPPIEALTEDSDYTGFLSPEVSESLRKAALRKLFHSAEFNICDGLDDYDGDYTSFEKLGDIITCDIKHQLEVAARKKAEEALEQDEEMVDPSQIEQDENTADAPQIEQDEETADASQVEQDDSVELNEQPALSIDSEKNAKADNYKKNQHELDGDITK